jgi:hypothetical protein
LIFQCKNAFGEIGASPLMRRRSKDDVDGVDRVDEVDTAKFQIHQSAVSIFH